MIEVAFDRTVGKFAKFENYRCFLGDKCKSMVCHFDSAIMLTGVTFEIVPGERVGCGKTGFLGFAVGTPDADIPVVNDESRMSALKFNGKCFVDVASGNRVDRADRVLFTPGGRAYLLPLPSPDTRTQPEPRLDLAEV